jgi:FkbM family methyltransferase
MLSRLQNSIAYRAKWAKFGVYYIRRLPNLDSIQIGGKNVRLSFPPNERAVHEWEFHKILLEDCYRLAEIKEPVHTVLDIGANIGLFAIAARHHFPASTIHCYEPNLELERHLSDHCSAIGGRYHMEAVGSKTAMVSLQVGNGSLHSVTRKQAHGMTPQIAFADAVSKLGVVDVLKLDCEGAEWDIFSDPTPWAKVRNLCMEYHLWAEQNSTIQTVEKALYDLGFDRIATMPSRNGSWGFAYGQK